MRRSIISLVVALAVPLLPDTAQSAGEIKGLMFADYYTVLSHHNKDIEGRHGFWFRRIYLTYDNNLTKNIKMRLRFEMNSPGDFTSNNKLTPYVKDAYLSYKTGGHELTFGIIPTPTKVTIEKIWGYRCVEKTPLDLQKLLSSRDLGISLKGHLDSRNKVSYWVMFGNGASTKGETDKGKKFYSQLGFKPADGFYLEAYGDYETQKENKTYYLYQGFASYETSWGRFGVLYARRHLKQETEGTDNKENDYDIFSAFAVVKATESVDIITRYDRMFGSGFKENYEGHKISYISFADNNISNLLIGGISWQAAQNVWLIPNIKYVFYDKPDEGEKPSEDIYINMTVFFKF